MLRNIIQRVALFSTEVQKSSAKSASASTITQYKEGQLVNRTSITLKKQEDIESYVVKTVQNYFRTTYKNGKYSLIQVWAKAVHCLSTVWIRSTLFKSPCKSKRIWATPFQLKLSPPSPKWATISLISTMCRLSREKIKKLPSLDQNGIRTYSPYRYVSW